MTDLFDLSGQVALITGSSRGIGRAIAERFAQHGARVVVSSRKLDACQAVADNINAEFGPGTAIAVAASISSRDQLETLVAETMAAFGRIDILVCNAATSPYMGPMSGHTDDVFRKVLENNVISSNWLATMVAPQMCERRAGSIILISSIAGFKGAEAAGAYAISKAADLQLARNLAVELGRYNVRVNCIAPGLIKTDMARALWEDPKRRADREMRAPLGRLGEPDELAGAAVFLAARSGSYVTGQTIVVDGGVLAV